MLDLFVVAFKNNQECESDDLLVYFRLMSLLNPMDGQ
jgi:hypothetical protein